MTLLDANVLVGLVDVNDQLSARCYDDLKLLAAAAFGVIDAALVETYSLIPDQHLRDRIPTLLQQLRAQHIAIDDAVWRSAFDWMHKYAPHRPNVCDALLVATGHKIWTYDSEFVAIWRALNGTAVPLAVTP